MRALIAAFTVVTLLSSVGIVRAEPPARDAVEAILARNLLERAAYRACAVRDKDADTEGILVRSWRIDLAESWEILRKAGYPEDAVRDIVDRFDLDKTKFAAATLATFCGLSDGWRRRVFLLMMSLPQPELRQLFKQ
jgi:hypothetical protein